LTFKIQHQHLRREFGKIKPQRQAGETGVENGCRKEKEASCSWILVMLFLFKMQNFNH
jgi:hypothetical protein